MDNITKIIVLFVSLFTGFIGALIIWLPFIMLFGDAGIAFILGYIMSIGISYMAFMGILDKPGAL